MSKNILIVGDLRSAINYGAVATSDQLIKHFESIICEDDNINTIDQRSYFSETPITGWDISVDQYRQEKLNRIIHEKESFIYTIIKKIRKFKTYKLLQKLWRRFAKEQKNGDGFYIPINFEEFESYREKVLQGEVFKFEAKKISDSDVVIINAEGSIVHGSDADGKYKKDARYVLFVAFLAKCVFNKQCYIINHCVDPDSDMAIQIIKAIYPKMDGVYVREVKSLNKLNEMGIRENVKFVPDALFTYESNIKIEYPNDISTQIDFTKPYICIGDSSGFDSSLHKITWDVYETLSTLIEKAKSICSQIIFIDGFMGWNSDIERVIEKHNLPRVNLCNCDYEQLYRILNGSQIFISGRWHASILAILSGTPILLWGADSFKTKALYELIDYPYDFYELDKLPESLDSIVSECNRIINDNVRETIKDKVKLLTNKAYQNFDMI